MELLPCCKNSLLCRTNNFFPFFFKNNRLRNYILSILFNFFLNKIIFLTICFSFISGVIGALCFVGTLVDIIRSFYKSFSLWSPDEEEDMRRNPHVPLNIDTSEGAAPKVDILTPKTKDALRIISRNCVTVDEG